MTPLSSRLLLSCTLATAALLPAQFERYELGRRVRMFERAWQQADEKRRKETLPLVKQAVTAFFTLRLDRAAEALTRAQRMTLRGARATPAQQWAASLALQPDRRLWDTTARSMSLQVAPFYRVDAETPAGARLQVALVVAGKEVASKVHPLVALPSAVELPLQGVPEGDHLLRARVLVGDEVLSETVCGMSFAADLNARLARLGQRIATAAAGSGTTRWATAELVLRSARALCRKRGLETDYPIVAMVREVETEAQLPADRPLRRGPGQHWLRLCTGRSTLTVRVEVPPATGDTPRLPVVLALHGAGGSENLFFDGYGDGLARRLARQRGWAMVAPRLGLGGADLPAALDELAKLFPIDREKVFVVGHSMGAAQAIAAASRNPERYAAVAALGGGGLVRARERLQKLPFLVAAGAEDFGLRGARGLRQSLQKAGVETVQFKVYPDVEHLVIVQAALPDVFRFFDERLRERQDR